MVRATPERLSTLLAALPASFLQQLLVLLLPHLLAAFLDQRRQTVSLLCALLFLDRPRCQSVPNRFRISTRLARNPSSRRTEPSLSARGAAATGEISRR